MTPTRAQPSDSEEEDLDEKRTREWQEYIRHCEKRDEQDRQAMQEIEDYCGPDYDDASDHQDPVQEWWQVPRSSSPASPTEVCSEHTPSPYKRPLLPIASRDSASSSHNIPTAPYDARNEDSLETVPYDDWGNPRDSPLPSETPVSPTVAETELDPFSPTIAETEIDLDELDEEIHSEPILERDVFLRYDGTAADDCC